MNVLITGGAGYIGSHVALKFLEQNCKVTIVDSLEIGSKFLVPKKAELVISDISDENNISRILKKDKIEVVELFWYGCVK